MKSARLKLDIPLKTLFTVAAFILSFYLLYRLISLVFLFLIAFLIMVAVNPLVTYFEKYRIPRAISISVVYLLLIVLLMSLVSLLAPPLVKQLSLITSQIEISETFLNELKLSQLNLQNLDIIANQIPSLPKLITFFGNAFNSIIILFTLFVISFYLLMERPYLHRHLIWLFKDGKSEKQAERLVNKIEEQVGGWVRAEIILMTIVGTLTYLSLIILNVAFALPLAILAGLLEILPNIGPIAAALVAIVVAYLTGSPTQAIIVAIVTIAIQQIENNLIIPYVMKRVVDIHPLVTIILLLVGLSLSGFIGALLAIPIYLIIKIFVHEWRSLKRDSTLLSNLTK